MTATHSLKAAVLLVLDRNRTRNLSAPPAAHPQSHDPMDAGGLLRKQSLGSERVETIESPDRDSVPGVADVSRIAAWLTHLGEHDPTIVAEVFEQCRDDPEALRYFLMRSSEVPADFISDRVADGRIRCRSCANLADSGRCLAAARGQIVGAGRIYHPIGERLQRCEGYRPDALDPDQRPGSERWPFLLDRP